jgi:hypothetical protein
MALVRAHHSGMDAPLVCEECGKERAEVVIEQFPTTAEHICLSHCRWSSSTSLGVPIALLASVRQPWPETCGSAVLDVAPGLGLRAVEKVRFARWTTRTRRWCAVEHREIVGSRTGAKFRRLSLSVAPCFLWECLTSGGPGLWSGESGKELVSAGPFLHPETERQATEVGRSGSGVWLEHRSLVWSQVPCAEQWLTVGPAQLIPFGRVSSMAQLGRCLQLRKRATSEKDTGR